MTDAVTDAQRDLRDAVRGLLASADGQGGAVWGRLCREVGVAGLAIPERYSGREAGRPSTPRPSRPASSVERIVTL